MRLKCWLVASSVVLVLVAGVASAAVRDNPTFRFDATDQRLARAVVLRKDELAAGWKGGFVKPVLEGATWPGYTQKDLVVTGAAETNFENGGASVDSYVWMLKTPEMAQLDVQRLKAVPALVEIRSFYTDVPSSVRLVSVSHIAGFPRVAPSTSAVRAILDVTLKGGAVQRQIDDYIDLVQVRSEIGLVVSALYSDRDTVKAAEIEFAKRLVERATPPKIIGYMLPLKVDRMPMAGSPYTFGQGLTLRVDKFLTKDDTWFDNTGPAWSSSRPDSLTCTATLGGQRLAGTGKGGCIWQIPTTAAGKQLVVTATAALGGAVKTISWPWQVEGAKTATS